MGRAIGGEIEPLPIAIVLYQRSTFSPCLFALVMDDLSMHIQDEVPWGMFFAANIRLIDETKEGISSK